MKKIVNKICEYPKRVLVISCILLVISFIAMSLTRINYDILVYLPKDIETIKGQDILTDDFDMGAYSIAVTTNMNSKDILKFENDISNVKGVNKVVSIYDVIGSNIPLEMLPSDITKYLNNDNTDILFITFNGSTSSNETLDAVSEIRKITNNKLKLGGMSSMVLDTMNLSNKEIAIYIVIAVVLCILILELSLDSYLAPVLLLANIGFAIVFNLGTNLFMGQISYITKALVAVLQLGVTTDFSIFLYHSYESKKKNMDKKDAMKEAINETFSSVMGSSLTTVAGFLVLCTMSLTLGKDLGIVMAKGVILGVVCVLTLFPSMLLVFDKQIEKTSHKSINLDFSPLNRFIVKNHVLLFIIFLVLLVPAYLGYKNIDVYYKMDRSLPETLESISTNTLLKDKFNIVSPEIILVSNDTNENTIDSMVNEIKNVDGVDFALSFSDISKLGISEDMLSDKMLKVFKSDNYQMVLVNSLYEVASDEINEQIGEINAIVKKYDDKAIVAGEGPLMKDLITISDTDFNNVNASSIICIFIILFIVLKNYSLPFLLICTIEAAIIINMSFSYFGGVTLPFIAPIVLGTIQLGATIDYAILLTTTYIGKRKNGISSKDAMIQTLNYNGKSILVSGLCFFAATFGVGVYSDIDMVGSLCTLISRGAVISMIVVIFVLPSILIIFDKLIMKTEIRKDKIMKKINGLFAVAVMALLLNPINTMALTKDEMVFGKIDNSGEIKSMFINEHLINNDKKDSLDDYSELKDILNINGDETYSIDGNKLTWKANGNDIYYQGKTDKELPISVSASYSLDGNDMNVSDMLGKSGHVVIKLKYTNSDKHVSKINGKKETLYTPFVVTYGTIISSKENTNIKVSSGKIISNGSKNIVTAIALPGLYESLGYSSLKDMNTITIEYDTTSFELGTSYSVITPKIVDSSDLKVFDKLDKLYDSSKELSDNMNKIDDSTKLLRDGSSTLKNSLEMSINKLSNDKSSALTDEQISKIASQANASVMGSLTDEYKKNIQDSTFAIVEKSLEAEDSEATSYVTNLVSESFKEFLIQSGKMEDYIACERAKATLEDVTTNESCIKIASDKSISAALNALSKSNNETASYVKNRTARKVSDAVSVSVLENTANSVSTSVASSVASLVGNGVKEESVKSITFSLNTLYNGVSQIDSGINELSDGVSKFNDEGIQKLNKLINGEVKESSTKIKELVKLGEKYQTFAGNSDNQDSETKFVLVMDGQKLEKEVKVNDSSKTETTFIQRIKNLFK